jgi:hypothetical protein
MNFENQEMQFMNVLKTEVDRDVRIQIDLLKINIHRVMLLYLCKL